MKWEEIEREARHRKAQERLIVRYLDRRPFHGRSRRTPGGYGGQLVAVTPDLRKAGIWRVTYFGADDIPNGHTEERGFAAAVHAAISEFGLDPNTIVVDPTAPKRERDAARHRGTRRDPVSWSPPAAGDERKALIISDLLQTVNSGLDLRPGPGQRVIPSHVMDDAAVLTDALAEYGYPALSDDVRAVLVRYFETPGWGWGYEWNAVYRRIEKAAEELAHGQHEIQNPNSSGQGYAPSHVETPFHDTLEQNGFTYSHSTRIWHPYYGSGGISDTRRGRESTLRHSYRGPGRSFAVGHDREGRVFWETKHGETSRTTRGTTVESLVKFLRSAARRVSSKR